MNLFSALGDTKAVLLEEDDENKNGQQAASNPAGTVCIYMCHFHVLICLNLKEENP